jgi:hypothetical protein
MIHEATMFLFQHNYIPAGLKHERIELKRLVTWYHNQVNSQLDFAEVVREGDETLLYYS